MTYSVVEQLTIAARELPPRLASAARYVAAHPFDAVTTPMRALARQAGHTPATFTRLAQALGLAGWEDLRTVLVEQTRQKRTIAPFSERPPPASGVGGIVSDMIMADTETISAVDTEALTSAAALLEQASHESLSAASEAAMPQPICFTTSTACSVRKYRCWGQRAAY